MPQGDTHDPEAADTAASDSKAARSGLPGAWDRATVPLRSPRRVHDPAESRRYAVLLAAYALFTYWFTQRPLSDWLSSHPDYNFYLVQPLIWGALAVGAYWLWHRLETKPAFSRTLVGIAFLGGVLHVAMLLLTGVLLNDIGQSPIAGRLVNYPKNGLYIITLLLGLETARAFVFTAWKGWNRRVAFIGTVIVFAVIATPLTQLTLLDSGERFFRIGAGNVLPNLAISFVATLMVEYGGLGVSFGYRFALLSFEWFSPELPDLDWEWKALVGVIGAGGAWWATQNIYESTVEFEERYPERLLEDGEEEEDIRSGGWWWVVTGIGVLVIILFSIGAFGVRPFIIEGISMQPSYERGDVAVIRDGGFDSLEVNDVIKFQQGNIEIVHRIVEILDDGTVVTQGDNVDRPDPPVVEEQYEGKVVFLLPKVGLPSLWVQSWFD